MNTSIVLNLEIGWLARGGGRACVPPSVHPFFSQLCRRARELWALPRVTNVAVNTIEPGAAPRSIAVEFIVCNPPGRLIHTYLVRCERTDASFHNFATHIGSATRVGVG